MPETLTFAEYEEIIREDSEIVEHPDMDKFYNEWLPEHGSAYPDGIRNHYAHGERSLTERLKEKGATKLAQVTGRVGSGHNTTKTREVLDAAEDAYREFLETVPRYTFQWTRFVDLDHVEPVQNGSGTSVSSLRNSRPFLLYTDEEREEYVDELAATGVSLDAPSGDLPRIDAYIRDQLLEAYDGDIEAVRENHVEVVPLENLE